MSSLFIRHGTLAVPRAFEPQFEAAKAYLSRDAVERALFRRVEHAHARHFALSVNHRNDDHFDPSTNTIAWDPYSALRTTRGGRQSPALGLGHEIDHAVFNPRMEQRLANDCNVHYDNAEERRVITGSERHAAHTLGEAVRTNHDGTCYRVASPVLS